MTQEVVHPSPCPKPYDEKRSPHWHSVEKAHLKLEPACAACGNTSHAQVHHKKPFHLYPELELDPDNLITLCEQPGTNHHLHVGHNGDWHKFNVHVEADAAAMLRSSKRTAVKAALAVACVLLLCGFGFGQTPPAPTPPPTLDSLLLKVQEIRKQKAELQKAEDIAVADLKARLKDLRDLLDSLNINPPAPVPPTPADAFKTDLAGFAKGQDKAQLAKLAALYRQAVTFCGDVSFTTTGQLIAAIGKAADSMTTPGSLTAVRARVLTELHAANLPLTDVPLTDALRKSAADIYGRAAAALEDAAK